MPDTVLVPLCVVSLTDSSTTCRCANCSLDEEKLQEVNYFLKILELVRGRAEM